MLTRRHFAFAGAAGALIACGRPSAAAPDPLRLTSPRAAHAAIALADGAVLFFGGCAADGCGVSEESAGVERYDPKSGRIEAAGRLTGPRGGGASALLPDGTVLLAGGWAGEGQPLGSVEIYDPRQAVSRHVADLVERRGDLSSAQLADGRVLFIGGGQPRSPSRLVEVFEPANGRVRRLPDLPQPRLLSSATTLADGRVLLAGGRGADNTVLSAASLFDPRTGSVTTTGPMAEPRSKHAAIRLRDGRVILLGGADDRDRDGKIRRVEAFDPATGRFATIGETLLARFKIPEAAVLLGDGRILLAGGAPQPEVFDPATGRSRLIDLDLGATLNFSTAVGLAGGGVLIAGGYTERGIRPTDRVWIIPKAALSRAAAFEAWLSTSSSLAENPLKNQ